MKRETEEKDCYNCKYFSEFKQFRSFEENGFSVFGCCFQYCKNDSAFGMLPIYVPGACCKNWDMVEENSPK
ncbi:MAG: hypothetical protein IJ489_10245 [Clostridia bacterium]|nr:hypothetical protein [Clostridia bacterium]